MRAQAYIFAPDADGVLWIIAAVVLVMLISAGVAILMKYVKNRPGGRRPTRFEPDAIFRDE